MLTIQGTTIELTCGDSAQLLISASNEDGTPYTFVPGDTIKFTVKKTNHKSDKHELIVKAVEVSEDTPEVIISLDPEDTEPLEFRTHYYDVELVKSSGWTDTFIANAIFKVGVAIG